MTGRVMRLPTAAGGIDGANVVTDHPDSDAWLDRDGRASTGDGPYMHRPLRRLRRVLALWFR